MATAVGLILTDGRSIKERREIISTLIDVQKSPFHKLDSSFVHSLDMQSDTLIVSDHLPYKSWGKYLKPEGTKKQFAKRLDNFFGERLALLGLQDVLKHLMEGRESKKLRVVKV